MQILIADKFPDSACATLEQHGFSVTQDPDLKDEALVGAIAHHQPDVLVVRSTKVQAEHLAASARLSLVIRAGAGVNTIDVASASERGVYVANCPGKNSIAVAELAFAHLLALDRNLVQGAADLKAGKWDKKRYSKAHGIAGRTLGLLGLGQIGLEMIPRAQAFGMSVVAYSRSLSAERAAELGIARAASPVALAGQCDVLSVHVALTSDTRGLVNAEVLGALPEGAFFINTSRGEVVDQDALEKAVRERGLRCGLDVFADEPTSGQADFEPGIFALDGVQGSHHIGASTDQAQNAVAVETLRIIETYRDEGRVLNCVNIMEETDATHLLVVRHRDRVGVLASVLGTLREADINVQGMENILFAGGEAATARIQVSAAPEAALLDRIARADDDILAVSLTALD